MSRRASSLGERIVGSEAPGVNGTERGFFSTDAVAVVYSSFYTTHGVSTCLVNLSIYVFVLCGVIKNRRLKENY